MLFASQASFLYLDSSPEKQSEGETLVIALEVVTEIHSLGFYRLLQAFCRLVSLYSGDSLLLGSALFRLSLRNEDDFVAMVRFEKIRGGDATLFLIAEYVIHPCCQILIFRRKVMINNVFSPTLILVVD